MLMNPISTPFLSAADEAFAQRLEANEDDAWRGLLSSVPPVFSNPVAEQIADLLVLKRNGQNQYDMGKLIRQMLYTKAALSSEREERPEDDDDSMTTVSNEDEDEDDDTMDVEEDDNDAMSVDERDDGRWPVDPEQDYGGDFPPEEEAYDDWCERRMRWLRTQSKETLINLVMMDEDEKEDYIDEHWDDSESE